MRQQVESMTCVALVLMLCVAPICNAAYFVFHKAGNARSGPGTKYRVIGRVSEAMLAQIPASFHDYEAAWIPIEEKTEYDKKNRPERIAYTKWVHTSLGAVVEGTIEDVEKYLAIKSSGWPPEIQELILEGKLKIGMTTHMVFYVWGKPDSIDETTGPDGVTEQWVYGQPDSKTRYLYFKNGLLAGIED